MFRVLQFNMQFGQLWDDADPDHAPIDLDQTIAEIRSQDADIVLLQEVERAQPGGSQTEPPPNYSRLQHALAGYDGFFAYPRADPRELPFGVGLAIFSRTPLRERVRHELPSPPVRFVFQGREHRPTDRLLIGAKTTLAGRELRIYNTHLLAFFMLGVTEEPLGQRLLILDELRRSNAATLVGGDFNVGRHEALVEQFAAAGYRTVQDAAVTWRRRPYVLDHIFHNGALQVVRYSVKPTPASDHHVLVAELEFVP